MKLKSGKRAGIAIALIVASTLSILNLAQVFRNPGAEDA